MDLREAIDGWLAQINSGSTEKQAQVQPQAPDDDPVMPKGGRLLIDGKATRHAILDTVKNSVIKRFPIEDDKYRIDLVDVDYDGPTNYTLAQQKQAILHNRKLGCSLKGTWRLTDKATGKVIDERRDAVMRVPYYTDRGTIINNGSEYTVISQARLSPGVYTRRKQNGDLESQFNVANGKGFRLTLDKSTGKMNFKMGQANLPLYPILRAFGITDEQLAKAWGSDVALVNSQKNDPKTVQKLYEKIAGYKMDPLMTPQNQGKFIQSELAKFGLDPSTVVRTLGIENAKGVTPDVILRASQKLLNVNRGIEEPDNRDNPRFSKFYGVEHMLGERIDKDAAKLIKPMLFRARRDKNLSRVGRNALGPYIDDFLSTSGLAQPGEEANPMSILIQQSRITRTGEGGISSPDLITPEARGVQGDYLGFVDFIATPESSSAGVDVRAAYGAVLGKDNKLYNIFRNMQTGKKEYLSLDAAADKTIAFPDQDPKAPYMYCMKNGVPTRVKTSEVDYIVPSFSRTLGAGINMNPMPTSIFGQRSFYSSKFWEQYLPQKEGEVPFVDSLMPDGKTTFNEYYGRRSGCITAPFSGTVTKVNGDEITVTGKNGKTQTFDLVTNLPYNRMTQFSLMPLVKKGMEVKEGDLLAHSNFTDAKTGAFNMGRNLKVCILPAPRGANSFEDAVVISEDAAKKLSTSRMYNFDQDTRNGISINKNKFLSAFPKEFTKEQAEMLDDSGVVKVGTELHRGDPIIAAIGPKILSAEDAQLGKLSSVLKNAVTNKSQTWNHDWPGVVTDVVAGPTGAKVLIKSEPPVKVGDKLCYDEDTEVLTSHGWKFFRDLSLEDNVATLNPETFEFDYIKPDMVRRYEHEGRMYHIENSCLDLTVTDNHRMFVQRRNHDDFEFLEAKDIFGKRVSYKKDGVWTGTEIRTFTFPAYQVGHRWGLITKPETTLSMDTFLMLLGMYLSEGNIRNNPGHRVFGIDITQIKPASLFEARDALDAAGVHYSYCATSHKISISGRQYAEYFGQFGKAWEKYIPEFVFGLSARQQRILFKWLMWGDGHSVKGMPKTYTTTSRRLADDVQRLCLHIGIAGRVMLHEKAGASHGMLDGRSITTKHDCYVVQIINKKLTPTVNHGHVRKQHVQEEGYIDYSGYVYCCTMPKWHAIYVRRNGHACWCGNSPRGALKGVTGTIIPMDKMPRDAVTNEPYDMIVNPMGFLSRVAPSQLMEIALGKVAKKTGQQIRIPQLPPPGGWLNWTKQQLADAGVSDTADVFDPQTGRTIKNVGDGYMYVQAMHHLAEKKYSARGIEGGYTQDQQPAKGGETGAKKISGFDVNALLSHGATEVLKDAMTIRGQKNEEYWRQLRLGLPIPEPGVPFIYQKFLNNLRAGGINVVEKGDTTSLMPQTDKEIEKLAGGRIIDSAQMVDANMNPVKGGLFDLGKTGGAGGTRWSMIELPEPIPNPVMEEPVRRVLGLTSKKMSDILSGKEQLNGKTGGAAIKEALENIDTEKLIAQARSDIKTKRGSVRDNAIKVLGYLTSSNDMKIKPAEWMISKVPVIPPAFRPISKVGDVALVPDTNELYKELLENKHNYELLKESLPDSALTDERLNIYKSVKAAFGLGNSITAEGQAKNLKGPIRQIIGTVPKWGQFQSKVVAKNQDLVGRSVTVPDKNLSMDQIGIPEDMAWTMYKPFVTRKLVQRGYSPIDAGKTIEEKTPTARHILDDVMKEKPVLMDRAPTWHKFNIMAFKPFITDGKEIRVCPMIDSGYNMDHDGDMQIGQICVKIDENDIYNFYKKFNPTRCKSMLNMLYYMRLQQRRDKNEQRR